MRRPPVVNGVRIDPLDRSSFVARIEELLDASGSSVVHFVPADPTVVARHDPEFRGVLNRGALNVADGMSVAWVLRSMGHPCERIAGSDAFHLLSDWGRSRSITHFLLGATPPVLEALQATLEREHPGIVVAGSFSPPFTKLTDGELAEIASRIRRASPDLVWVGLGTPKQDFLADRLREAGVAPIILTVGAAFDFLAGSRKRAPNWMQAAGLEWCHRLATEPRSLWKRYLIGNALFVGGVLRDAASRRGQRA